MLLKNNYIEIKKTGAFSPGFFLLSCQSELYVNTAVEISSSGACWESILSDEWFFIGHIPNASVDHDAVIH